MEINKYQQAYQNIQAELPVDNEDIVVLRELVEKSIPKQVEKATREEYEETGYTRVCPTCGQFAGTKLQSCGIQYGIEENDYCCSCGQRLKWSDEND